MQFNDSEQLIGLNLVLEALEESHFDGLYQAAQDPSIWKWVPTNAMGVGFNAWFEVAMKAKNNQQQYPFAIRRKSDLAIIGSSRFYDVDMAHSRLSIGYTWYIPEVWGSGVNPECKYLLLEHAFETLNMNRIQLKTDLRNKHSQAAMRKLGAQEEGILRHHMVLPDGTLRDTVIFSIIKPEWPEVRDKLKSRFLDSTKRNTQTAM